ncbi:MAG TPA: hypothetical protein VMC83_21520 [Streptosporangiaceae bacterium]|nr:hypothetical protein [Streptosporangiaceae bacterium]
MTSAPLADPIAEARRIIELGEADGLVLRALGGVAICLQAPDGHPRLPRQAKDIDLAAAKGASKRAAKLMVQAGYAADEMFNALRGSRRLLFADPANGRHLDVFIGEFSMCHDIPMTARLGREPLTVPREELLLSKLQIFELTANDQADIYNLLFHNEVGDEQGGISASFIAALCAGDWGLWRTCQLNIERGLSSLGESALGPAERDVVAGRLDRLRERIDAEPKSMKWRIRDRVGDRVRWYAEPEEEPAGV